MKYSLFLLLSFIAISNLNGQMKMPYYGHRTIKPKFDLVSIGINEIDTTGTGIDSIRTFSSGFSYRSDSGYFRGSLKRAIINLLHEEIAFMRFDTPIPDRFIQYYVNVNRNIIQRNNGNTRGDVEKVLELNKTNLNTRQFEDVIFNTLKQYYRFEVTKVVEPTEVYVIYKNDMNLLMAHEKNCDEHEEIPGSASPEFVQKQIEENKKQIKNGTWKKCLADFNFNNGPMGLGFILTNWSKQIVVIADNSVDNHKYHIQLKYNEENSIESLTSGLARNGLKLVKEKREREIYHVKFLN